MIQGINVGFLLTKARNAERWRGDKLEVDGDEHAGSLFKVLAVVDDLDFLVMSALRVSMIDTVAHLVRMSVMR